MAKPKEHKAKVVQKQVMGEKANESPQIYAQVGDGGGVVATGRANFYYIRLRGDDNRVTQCYSLVPLADGDLIYVRQSQDRKLRYYEFVEFIQAAGGGTGPPVPYHDVLGPYHGDAATAAIVQGDVLIGDATPEVNRLAIGTPDQLLTVNAAGTDPVWASNLRQILELEFNDAALLTIAAGTVTRTQVYHVIAAQVGVADDLDNVLGGVEGDELVIRPDTGDTITVRHNQGGAGDFWLAGGANIALDNEDHLRFICDANGRWCDQSGGAGLVIHNHSGAGAGGDDLRPETISSQGYLVGPGCVHTTLASAVVAVNAAGPPALGTEYVIRVMAGTTTEVGNITIPAYCTVQGAGENTIINMGAFTLTLSGNSSLKDLVVLSSNATAAIDVNNATNAVLRNVRCVESGGGYCFWMRGATTAYLYHCTAQATAINARGFQVSDTAVVLLWDCDACDSTNFAYGLNLNNVAGTAATALYCRFQAATDDILVSANAALTHFDCQFDPNNSTFASGTHTALPTKRFNQWLIVAEQGGDFQELSEAVAWINAQGDNAANKRYGILMAAGNYVEAGNVTVPSYVGVFGQGWATRLDMGANELGLRTSVSLESLYITGTAATHVVELLSGYSDRVIQDCWIFNTSTGMGVIVDTAGSTDYIYGTTIDGGSDGLYIIWTSTDAAAVYLNDCRISGDTDGLDSQNPYCIVRTEYCTITGGTNDVNLAGIWHSKKDSFDPNNCVITGTADMQNEDLGDYYAFTVTNTSGGAVADGAVGYIDSVGEFKTTTTAYSDVAWVVVVLGGANGADIWVARRGRVTVTLNGNCSAGDYLYTSTTAGQAQPQSYTRPELFAIALTANAGGAGGTCSALLLCHTRFLPITSSVNIFSVSGSSDTDWRTTINGAPVGATVTYTAPLLSGAEDCIDPTGANLHGKLRLYNETRGDYGLIDDVNQAANTITLTAAAPGAWANGDTITVRSQTCTAPAPPPYYFDLDLSDADNTVIPVTARAIEVEVATNDSAAAGGYAYTHPWEAYSGPKVRATPHYVVATYTYRTITIPLIQRRFCTLLNASGAATGSQYYRIMGIWQAEP